MPDDAGFRLREAVAADTEQIAQLIHRSTNAWYRERLGHEVFSCAASDVRFFVEVYDALDPGRCLVIEDVNSARIAGSCFVHPRPTHVSLGILNVDPDYFGRGIARRLVEAVTAQADKLGVPTRLVSSAMNLDSYSLYTRAGFVPYAFFQDVLIQAPAVEPAIDDSIARVARQHVRAAKSQDVGAMAALEHRLMGIMRPDDLAYFVENLSGCWQTLLMQDPSGDLLGYLASVDHPACRIIGPGVSVDEPTMIALLAAQLAERAGRTMLIVAPANRPAVIRQLYRWGGRNCETHVAQYRPAPGTTQVPVPGCVFLPTFLPESA